MAVRLFDSLSRDLKAVGRSDGKTFRMYCCGPTVYGPAHIGNFRTFILQDVLRRVLELEFGAGSVKHVRNVTDVDDRTIGQAVKENRPIGEITAHWTKLFHQDCAELNLLPPHVEPSATTHIAEQVAMIEGLMAKGHAYVAADGSVYFKIGSFPDYGALSRIKERELKATDAAADSDHKDSIGDFALWKAYKPAEDGEVKWPGPKGAAEGRPGWHIECSAMSRKHLGDTIDLHAGGVDLLFPHHENEIAQSEGCTGHTFANHWYHTEHLLVDGKKMSKSLGNLYTLEDLKAKGFSPMAVRYTLLSGHPRKQLNFTLASLADAGKNLSTLSHAYDALKLFAEGHRELPSNRFNGVIEQLRDDLNLPAALGELYSATKQKSETPAADLASFELAIFVLGLRIETTISDFPETEISKAISIPVKNAVPAEITALAEKRWAAKQSKDWPAADALRGKIQAAGWQMLDRKDGYSLEPLKK